MHWNFECQVCQKKHNYICTLYFHTILLPTDYSFQCWQLSNYRYSIYKWLIFYFFFDLRGVSGPAYAHHDYSPRPTGHPASPGAGRHCGGDRRAHRGSNPGRGRNKSHGWPQQLDPQVLCGLFYTILHVAKAKKAKTTFARRNGYIIYNSKSCSLNNPILNLFFKNY